MGLMDGLPDFMPKPELHLDITSGSLTFTSSSKLVNPADYLWNPNEVVGAVFKNGSSATSLTIDASTGAITASAVSVASGDLIEVRFDYTGPVMWPWHEAFTMRRSAFLTVPVGNATFDFDDTSNPMPVPTLDLAFGWDSDSKLKLGVKVIAADGASQNYTAFTRRAGGPQESNSSISTSSSSVQTHVSTFTKSDVTADCEFELWLKSGTGSTRVEDRVHAVFTDKTQLASYPSDFPTNVKLQQTKSVGKLKIDSPH